MARTLADLGADSVAYSVMTGELPQDLGQSGREALAQALLEQLGATAVTGVTQGLLSSFTGVSAQMPPAPWQGELAANLQVALRPDADRSVTRVWLGHPLINLEH